MTELKPCPFCGDKAKGIKTLHSGDWIIGCQTKNCRGNRDIQGLGYKSSEQAIEAWNRRDEPTCETIDDGRELECPECGMRWRSHDSVDQFAEWACIVKPTYCPNCGERVIPE